MSKAGMCLLGMLCVPGALHATAVIFATGMNEPETITNMTTGIFLVVDAGFNAVMSVPANGGAASTLVTIGGILRGGVVFPSGYGSRTGDLFVAAGSSGYDVTTGGSATGFGTNPSGSGWATPVVAPAGFGPAGGELLIPDEIGGTISAVDSSGTASTFATVGTPVFGAVFAPAGFGSVAGDLLVNQVSGTGIYAVNGSGTASLFANVPAGAGLRQMAFVPAGFGWMSGDLLVSNSSGLIDVVNSSGQTVSLANTTSVGMSFNPRGLTFLDAQHLLVSDEANGRILELTANDFASPEPGAFGLAAIGVAALAGCRKIRRA